MMRLSPEKRARILRYRRVEDRLRAFLGEVLVRVYAVETWGLVSDEIMFHQTAHQKPYLLHHPECQFNISHSGEWVACAFHDVPIGLDIEQVRSTDLTIAEQFFSPSEVEYLRRQSEPKQLTSFFRLWTLKESYIKAKGEGLSIPLNSCSFDLHQGIQLTSCSDADQWAFQCYSVVPGYEIAACAPRLGARFPDTIQLISGHELLDRFKNI
jgi:4'-phosphopantetheinyl transferase